MQDENEYPMHFLIRNIASNRTTITKSLTSNIGEAFREGLIWIDKLTRYTKKKIFKNADILPGFLNISL